MAHVLRFRRSDVPHDSAVIRVYTHLPSLDVSNNRYLRLDINSSSQLLQSTCISGTRRMTREWDKGGQRRTSRGKKGGVEEKD
jgi:hypothetical protein